MRTKHVIIRKLSDDRFLFWKHDLWIKLWHLHIDIMWHRTFIFSDEKTRKFCVQIYWFNDIRYTDIIEFPKRKKEAV